jgi:hypothetical protein
MKIKPKKVLVDLPIYLLFETLDEVPQFAAHINAILHGKMKAKYEDMGSHAGQFIGLFYLERNDEYHDLREFVRCYVADGEEARMLRETLEEKASEKQERQTQQDKQDKEYQKEHMTCECGVEKNDFCPTCGKCFRCYCVC